MKLIMTQVERITLIVKLNLKLQRQGSKFR